MNEFTLIFLAMLAAGTALKLWLARRQIRHVRACRGRVPEAFAGAVPLEDHRKACDYAAAQARFSLVGLALTVVLVLAWTLGGGLGALDEGWRAAGLGPVLTGLGVIASAMLINGALELPLSIYHTFVLEQRFGFNRTTPRRFASDLVKGLLVSAVLLLPLAAAVLWLMEGAGTLWWLYAWALWAAFSILMLWAYPVLIAPLFNRFSPLEDPGLRERIEDLLRRCGFSSRGVFVMDGSSRSGHGNAYFTGLGRNKRIVFFDTLLDSLSHDQVEAVLAHELGHYRKHHVHQRLATMLGLGLLALAALGWLAAQPEFYRGLGVASPSSHSALLLFAFVAPVFSVLLRPVGAWLSRRHEFQADEYASRHSDAAALIDALVRLYKDNASTLTPDPVYSAFYDSHPPAAIRVAHLDRLAAPAGG